MHVNDVRIGRGGAGMAPAACVLTGWGCAVKPGGRVVLRSTLRERADPFPRPLAHGLSESECAKTALSVCRWMLGLPCQSAASQSPGRTLTIVITSACAARRRCVNLCQECACSVARRRQQCVSSELVMCCLCATLCLPCANNVLR